jgi:ATP:ADP antiporter, AAA family
MLLFSTYISHFLRGVKDTVLVSSLGAEFISFIKFYGVLPSSLIFFLCFTRLANILQRDKLYYAIILFFCSFFMVYAFILNPLKNQLQPDLSNLITLYPAFKYQIILLQNWTISLLYIMCEICGTAILTLLFWQFTNDLYSIKEAKENYALFGIIGQSGIIIAGFMQALISSYFFQNVSWDYTMKWMMFTIILASFALIIIYRFLYKKVFFNKHLCSLNHRQDKKVHLSIAKSIRHIFSSRYLWLIMLIVFCYGMSANIIDIIWKNLLKNQYTTEHEYSSFVGKFNIIFGFISVFVMLCGTYILRKFTWLTSALFTPFMGGVTGAIFLLSIIFKEDLLPLFYNFDNNILLMGVIMGSIQIMLFKSLNYTFVESTKEIAFIPLDRELKIKGKAAIDIIGGRFGKAFGAITQQLMFQCINPNLNNLTQEFLTLFIIIIAIWIFTVISLNRHFLQITNYS